MKYVDGTVCVLGIQSWCFESSLSISDWAAWVQAVGSVAAIVGAFLIARHQFALQRDADRKATIQDEIDVLESFLMLLDDSIERLSAVYEHCVNEGSTLQFFAEHPLHGFAALPSAFDLAKACFENRPWLAGPYVATTSGIEEALQHVNGLQLCLDTNRPPDGRARGIITHRGRLGERIDRVIEQRVHFEGCRQALVDTL